MFNSAIDIQRKIFLTIIVHWAFFYSSPGSTILTDTVNNQQKKLDFYIGYALENNPRIKALSENVKIKFQDAKLATSLPDPMIMAKAGSGNSFKPIGIGISQMIMWPGKLSTMKKSGELKAQAEIQNLAAEAVSLEADIRSSYARLYAIGQTIKSQKENIELLKIFENAARVQYIASGAPRTSTSASGLLSTANSPSSRSASSGMQSMNSSSPSGQMSSSPMSSSSSNQSTLLKIQVEQAMLEDQILAAESNAESERKKFRSLLGGTDSIDIPFPDHLEPVKLTLSDKEILDIVRHRNPRINSMRKEIDAAKEMSNSARQGLFPDISLGLEYMRPSGSSSMNTSGSSRGNIDASISMTIPLWVGKKRLEIARATSMESQMSFELLDMKNMLVAETEVLLNELRDSERRIRLFQDVLVPQSKQIVDILQVNYRTGQNSYLDIIDAQRTLLDLELSLTNEKVRHEIAVAGLIRNIGTEQPWLYSNQNSPVNSENIPEDKK
ncbi:MAG: TolC family protein [Fibrobacter sp.]|nr:TolC family protein [Fibrobacter sp.]